MFPPAFQDTKTRGVHCIIRRLECELCIIYPAAVLLLQLVLQ